MNRWQSRSVPFKFQFSDWTLFSVTIPLQVRSERLIDQTPSVDEPKPSIDEIMDGSQGFLIRGLPIVREFPSISRTGDYLRYVPLQYQHCYIDLGLSFEIYQQKFSSKTRSTIKRKIKKYAEHCGGTIPWKTYKAPDEMRDFFRLARTVSRLTYQERLLDAGIPESEDFISQAESLAADQQVRAFILFDGERPVAYLYCPVQDDVLIYAYLGYDPDYMHLSVGTVLQWLAVEQLFDEACFRYFDFTEGESDHKRLFATHQRQCANVFLVKDTLRNAVLIHSHRLMDRLSNWLGTPLERFGVKARIKRLLRFAR
jgi:CelD/BcsL family acetyltransferase involved in cellulose biosynthesis